MIYISSTNVKNEKIKDSIEELAKAGFKNIELSGGTQYYIGLEEDILEKQSKYNLNIRLHNYFPPPKKSFVLNLCSIQDTVIHQSKELVKKAILLSKKIKAKEYGLHAGFRISPKVEQLGKNIDNQKLSSYSNSLNLFKDNFLELSEFAAKHSVSLYLENNVLTHNNYERFNQSNPFFLTNTREYQEISQAFSFPLLLDVAHLKVSCQSLNLDFEQEFNQLITKSNYLHISDNDGCSDSNNKLSPNTQLFDLLWKSNLNGKSFTLEVYDGIDAVIESYNVLEGIISKDR